MRCPYHWADDVACMYENKIDIQKVKREAYFVFGFHPIHIFLNTEKLERYEATRFYSDDINILNKMRSVSPDGAVKILQGLLSLKE